MSSEADGRGGISATWQPSPSRRLKDLVKRGLGLPWEIGFGALGLLPEKRPEPWRSSGGLRVLVVAPHPDDEVYGCGGTILLHRAAGDRVTVAHVTDGRRSRALGLGPDEMAERRRAEARAAGEVLGIAGIRWLGLPEADWDEAQGIRGLKRVLDAESPDLVYAPSRVDFHPEHRRVAQALARALGGGRGRTPGLRIRIYPVQVPLTGILTNRVAPTGVVARRSRLALERYETQLTSLRSSLRAKRYAGLRYRAGPQAEVYWELPAEGYRAIHDEDGGHQPSRSRGSFRGLRPLPFTDPLAYLAGRGERWRLRSVAERVSGAIPGRSPAPEAPKPR